MQPWSNIEITPQDPEIITINNVEKKLGKLPEEAVKIRELITRLEVCHFKVRQHIRKIKDSIKNLTPKTDTTAIGKNHIHNGESVLKNDTTGKSLIGQQYVWALKEWLNDTHAPEISECYDTELRQQIHQWLGDVNPDKTRLVRLLLARMTWDWSSYEDLQQGGALKDLELQTCKMDICHYAFPENLNLLLKGIGQMRAVEEREFEGCGSYNHEIKEYLEIEFSALNKTLELIKTAGALNKNDRIRAWLTACLAKTIKENIKISTSVTILEP